MKTKIFYVLSLVVVIALTGCSGLLGHNKGVVGKETKKTTAIVNQIESLNKDSSKVNNERLDKIGAWAGGVDYALDKDTNQSPAVAAAQEANERVIALANKPDFKELQGVYQLIDMMVTNQAKADKLLIEKDQAIYALNAQIKNISESKDTQIDKITKQSEKVSLTADQYKETIKDMDSFWGFGAISYGIKKFLTKAIWTVVICLILYFGLRFGASLNPVVGAIFSVFESLASIVVRTVKTFVSPRAVSLAGYAPQAETDGYKRTLTHIVDAIQLLKEKEGAANEHYTLDDLLIEVSKSMDKEDKNRVDAIKKDLNWK